jgi:Ser/Thr protein kinase RdoA (MazF antagonist)
MSVTPFGQLSYRGQVGRLRQLARAALVEYELDPAPTRLTLLAHMDNTTFRVETGDSARYLLRVHRVSHSPSQPRRTLANVLSEMQWLAVLRRDTDLVVPAPIATRAGDLCVVAGSLGVPEPRICTLLGWVDGRFIDAGLTATHLEQVGAFIARLHDHAAGWQPPAGFDRGRVGDLPDEVAASVLALFAAHYGSADVAAVECMVHTVQATQRALAHQPGTFGLIHGDIHQENYLFLAGEVRAIDFDDCGWGLYLYDLAVTLSEISYKPDYPTLRAALLRGYQRLRPLPAGHERHLDALIAWRAVQLAVWFLEHRDHPGFANWQAEVRYLLDVLGRHGR